MTKSGDRLIAAAKEARALIAQEPQCDVWIGPREPFVKSLHDNGVELATTDDQPLTTFGGVPIRTDARIPEGVWCMVPAGKTLTDEGVRIGSCSAEYEKAAKGFAAALAYQRRISN